MAQRRILVIEDDTAIRQGVVDALEIAGYETLSASRGDDGLDEALRQRYDLLLLDLVLPGLDGLDILRHLRKERPETPVIVLTARGDEADRLEGFRRGADDYVVKPFSVKELLARVDAVLRRTPERPAEVARLELTGGHADLARCEVRFDDGSTAELSELENRLLSYLARHADRAVSRDELLSRVWDMDPRGIETRTVDMHIARLREKLRDDRGEPRIVLTVRGKGYKLARGTAPAAAERDETGS